MESKIVELADILLKNNNIVFFGERVCQLKGKTSFRVNLDAVTV